MAGFADKLSGSSVLVPIKTCLPSKSEYNTNFLGVHMYLAVLFDAHLLSLDFSNNATAKSSCEVARVQFHQAHPSPTIHSTSIFSPNGYQLT
mmetsp:Transcript_15772/g.18201  ORF Transcript_15772/g.18201 Transcript_15772/m.18201 type:complete len:92 (+) Transcript_15772:412-687(+)